MSRTDEQKLADEALTEAIKQVRAAYMEPSEAPDVITDFVVLVAATRFDDDGETTSVFDMLFRDGSISDHAAYGLLEVGKRFLIRMEDKDG